MNNELTDRLAVLLRELAEKNPKLFDVQEWEESGIRIVMTDPEGWEIRLDRLEEPAYFPLDCMCSIAAAVGYWIDLKHDLDIVGDVYTSHWGPCGYNIEWGYCFRLLSQREASLAALLAIVNHVLEEI